MVAGEEFPQFDEFGEIFSFENSWHALLPQTVLGVDCFNPSATINPDENLMLLTLSAIEFREMFSALYAGAELQYPEKYLQIIANFLKGIHCPPELEAEAGDCLNYPNYASFITYEPANPFTEPDTVPPDYEVPPFFVNSGFEYPAEFGYLASDVFVPLSAVTIDPLTFLTLNYPTIKISVLGSGQIELDLLSVIQGGYLVLKVGSPPNIGDILGEIILESGLKIIDLANDSASLPPESDIVIAEEINIEAAVGVQTDVYLVFLPKLDDSLIPLGFGGGIRTIGLCGFEEVYEGDVIMDVRYNVETGDLEKLVGGVWAVFATCEQLVACAPEGGGGGGAAALTVKTYRMGTVGFGTVTSTTTSFADISGCHIVHTPSRSNMLVIAENISLLNSAANQPITIRMVLGGTGVGLDAREQALHNSVLTPMAISDRWEVTPDIEYALDIQWKTTSGTMTRSERTTINITIIEYDNTEDLYVQDIRVLSDGTIQKKIGGVWIDVSVDLAVLLADIQADADAAAAAAAAAQSTANTATTVNSTQAAQISALITENTTQNGQIAAIQAVNTAQGALLTAHEARLDDIDLSIAGLLVEQTVQNGRLDELEAASGGGSTLGVWGGYPIRAITDVNAFGGKYSSSLNTWDDGEFPFTYVGWEPDFFSGVRVDVENAMRFNSMVYLRVGIVLQTFVPDSNFIVRVNGGEWSNILPSAAGNWMGFVKLQQFDRAPTDDNYDAQIEIQSSVGTNEWRFKSATWFYININPFDGTTPS